jgi:hypothetical protein
LGIRFAFLKTDHYPVAAIRAAIITTVVGYLVSIVTGFIALNDPVAALRGNCLESA